MRCSSVVDFWLRTPIVRCNATPRRASGERFFELQSGAASIERCLGIRSPRRARAGTKPAMSDEFSGSSRRLRCRQGRRRFRLRRGRRRVALLRCPIDCVVRTMMGTIPSTVRSSSGLRTLGSRHRHIRRRAAQVGARQLTSHRRQDVPGAVAVHRNVRLAVTVVVCRHRQIRRRAAQVGA